MPLANEPGAFLPSAEDIDATAHALRKLIDKGLDAPNTIRSLRVTASWLEHIAEVMDEAENPTKGTLNYIQ